MFIWFMLKFGIRIKRMKEIVGQIPRLLADGAKSFLGELPVGNPARECATNKAHGDSIGYSAAKPFITTSYAEMGGETCSIT
jgi:hypothetical protein